MACKFDLSEICRRAWQQARIMARGNNKAARPFLAEAFRAVWRKVKVEVAEREMVARMVVVPREECATRSQVSYIEGLLGRGKSAPAGLTKAAATALIHKLKASKGVGLRSEDPSFDYGWY